MSWIELLAIGLAAWIVVAVSLALLIGRAIALGGGAEPPDPLVPPGPRETAASGALLRT